MADDSGIISPLSNSTKNTHTMKPYSAISQKLNSIALCRKTGNAEWEVKHGEKLDELIHELPSGSGIDCGTKLLDESKPDRLIFQADFHHMDENGYYDGWTEHQVIVTPSLAYGFNIRITGRNRNGIKEYITDIFNHALNSEIE